MGIAGVAAPPNTGTGSQAHLLSISLTDKPALLARPLELASDFTDSHSDAFTDACWSKALDTRECRGYPTVR
jgi:hypothetical protein